MNVSQVLHIIARGEGIGVEFKTSASKLNKDTFESICAFFNRSGGYLLLGVKNDGEVSGDDEDAI